METENRKTNPSTSSREVEEAEVDPTFEPFELQPSIIDTVVDMCPEHEAEEIWRVIGHSLVEQARDLLEEVCVLSCAVQWLGLYGAHYLELPYRREFFWRYGDSWKRMQSTPHHVVRMVQVFIHCVLHHCSTKHLQMFLLRFQNHRWSERGWFKKYASLLTT